MGTGLSDYFLTNRIHKKWWYITSETTKRLWLCLAQSLVLIFTHFNGARCRYLLPCGEVHMEMNCRRPPANSQQRIESLQAHKDLTPDNKHVTELESESLCSSVELSDKTTALANTLNAAL